MPFVCRSVEPVHIRRNVMCKTQVTLGGEHEAFANASLVHVLNQLADLSRFVERLFHELAAESSSIVARSERLKERALTLAAKARDLNVLQTPLPESTMLAAAARGSARCAAAFKEMERRQECSLFTPYTRPPCVHALYDAAAHAATAASNGSDAGGAAKRLSRQVAHGSAVQRLEPVLAAAGPGIVALRGAKQPQRRPIRRSNETLRRPRRTLTCNRESTADSDLLPTISGKSMLSSSDASIVAIDVSNEAFDRLLENRALARGRGRSCLKRRLTLSGTPSELAVLRLKAESGCLPCSSAQSVTTTLPPSSRHLDLQPSTSVSSKNPDEYVHEVSSSDEQQCRMRSRRQSLLGRLLRRSRSLPRDFERRRRQETQADASVPGKDDAAGRLTTACQLLNTLVDDRSQKVFVNFYGELGSRIGTDAIERTGVACPRGTAEGGGGVRATKGRPCFNGSAKAKSRSHVDLPSRTNFPPSKMRHPRSASAERPRRDRSRGADGESFLSHTLPCLFRRRSSSDEDESTLSAANKGCRDLDRNAAISQGSSASARVRRSAQQLSCVTLRKRDSKATVMSTSSGRWSGSDRYSFGSDLNFSSTAGSNHKLSSSRVSVDHDSAVCMDSSSRGCSRSGGSSDLATCCMQESGTSAASPFRQRLVSLDDEEPLFVRRADEEVLSLYSVDQDGFYTTMHSDSCLLEIANGVTHGSTASIMGAGRQPPMGLPSGLRDGTAQTDVTFATTYGDNDAQTTRRWLFGDGERTADIELPFSHSRCSEDSSDPAAYSNAENRSTGVQVFHLMVAITPDASDEEDGAVTAESAIVRLTPSTGCGRSSSTSGTSCRTQLSEEAVDNQQEAASATSLDSVPSDPRQCLTSQHEKTNRERLCPSTDVLMQSAYPEVYGVDTSSPRRQQSMWQQSPLNRQHPVTITSQLSEGSGAGSKSSKVPPAPPARRSCDKPFDPLLKSLGPADIVEHSATARVPQGANMTGDCSGREALHNDCDSADIGAAEFPQMEADAEALNIATARCLSVLSAHFKVKGSASTHCSTPCHLPSTCSSPTGPVDSGKARPLPSAGNQVSNLIEQARRMSMCSPLSLATCFEEEARDDAAAMRCRILPPRDSDSGTLTTSRRSVPCFLAEAEDGEDRTERALTAMRVSRSSGSIGRRLQQLTHCPQEASMQNAPRQAAVNSHCCHTSNACGGSSASSRALSYRIANGTVSRDNPDPDQRATVISCNGTQVANEAAFAEAAIGVLPLPPRALSYRVANSGDPHHALLLADASADGSANPKAARPPAACSRASIREFMKGIYENSERHLPVPAAPKVSELISISRTSRSPAGGRAPVSTPKSASTFLPGTEFSGIARFDRSDDFNALACDASEDALFCGSLFNEHAVVLQRPLPALKERPRSSIMTKGDKKESDWMQASFASLLQRRFEDDKAYASLEALRQDESSLLSLMDSVQGHGGASSRGFQSASAAVSPASQSSVSAYGAVTGSTHTEV